MSKKPPEDPAQGQSDKLENVSRETFSKLKKYHDLLVKWQKSVNLVSNNTLNKAWQRHFADSAQLYDLIENKQARLIDIGSGAGFPGLVLAIMGISDVTLIESDLKKGVFMREVARETETPVTVISARIEEAKTVPADILTARALAPLEKLLGYATAHLKPDGYALFLKGGALDEEISQARRSYEFNYEIYQSKTDQSGKIVRISALKNIQ